MRVAQRIVTRVKSDSWLAGEDVSGVIISTHCFLRLSAMIDIPQTFHMNDVAYVATKKRNR